MNAATDFSSPFLRQMNSDAKLNNLTLCTLNTPTAWRVYLLCVLCVRESFLFLFCSLSLSLSLSLSNKVYRCVCARTLPGVRLNRTGAGSRIGPVARERERQKGKQRTATHTCKVTVPHFTPRTCMCSGVTHGFSLHLGLQKKSRRTTSDNTHTLVVDSRPTVAS